jgi:hypothetical protein
MAKANRTAWEREQFFDDVYALGLVELPRHKFIYLADQTNMCPGALRAWLDHWREYIDDQNEDLQVLMVGEKVVLWRAGWEKVGPKTLTAALASAN